MKILYPKQVFNRTVALAVSRFNISPLLIFHSAAFLLLLYLDDSIFSQPLGLTSLFLIFQPSPLTCVVSVFLVHIAGTLCSHTFVYHLYLYLASILFLKPI